jgi:predicted Zn-dependent protease
VPFEGSIDLYNDADAGTVNLRQVCYIQQQLALQTLQAQLALNRNEATEAISKLQTAAPYELAMSNVGPYVVYVRGVAFLNANRSAEAIVEFQKILGHRGLVSNTPMGALAHLQMGRAYALRGDTAKAKAAYQDCLTLWKDADPDIPIFIAE